MFKLESYISPFLVSYLDKYIKLQQQDFQLSLWGGDAVLNKVDLRLDALEGLLNLPITFVSGHVHELRLHVPWTKLGSEPVLLTFNTIECVVKVRDASAQNKSDGDIKAKEAKRALRHQENAAAALTPGEDVPAPGYIQSLVNRIVNNVNIVVNNLILKFVEDDVVLSINVKSGECHSVNAAWQKSFVDITPEDTVLRRLVSVSDLTVCLDKRNTTGKIEAYQEPLLYKCSVTCRAHMHFDSASSKFPSSVKFSFLCHEFDVSLTDAQLPMFLRLYNLFVAIWFEGYGSKTRPADAVTKDAESKPKSEGDGDNEAAEKEDNDDDDDDDEQENVENPEGSDGWMSWAWSYVPPILPQEDYEEFYGDVGPEGRIAHQTPPESPVVSLGFYADRGTLTLKATRAVHESPLYGPQKLVFRPLVTVVAEGVAIEILCKGDGIKEDLFSSCQFGVSAVRAYGRGECVCGVRDHFEDDYALMIPYFNSGCPPSAKGSLHFLTGSLFDELGAENRRVEPRLFLDRESHLAHFSESFAIERFGAFWADSVYAMESPEEEEEEEEPEGDGASISPRPPRRRHESLTVRVLFGPAHSVISSGLVHRLERILFWAQDHQYDPYVVARDESVGGMAAGEAERQTTVLTDFVPTRSYVVALVHWKVRIFAADHGFYDAAAAAGPRKLTAGKAKTGKDPEKSKRPSSPLGGKTLPCLALIFDRVDFQTSLPMYPSKIVAAIRAAAPADVDELAHLCYIQRSVNVFGLQAILSYIKPKMAPKSQPSLVVMNPFNAAAFAKTLINSSAIEDPELPRHGYMLECSQLQLHLTPPQLHLFSKIVFTWVAPPSHPSGVVRSTSMSKTPPTISRSSQLLAKFLGAPIDLNPNPFQKNSSVVDDTFHPKRGFPTLTFQMSSLQSKFVINSDVFAVSGTLSSVRLSLQRFDAVAGNDADVCLLSGKEETDSLRRIRGPRHQDAARTPEAATATDESEELVAFALQLPTDWENIVDFDVKCRIIATLRVQGVAANLDPLLITWLDYAPTPKSLPEKRSSTTLTTKKMPTPSATTDSAVETLGEDNMPELSARSVAERTNDSRDGNLVKTSFKVSGKDSTVELESESVAAFEVDEDQNDEATMTEEEAAAAAAVAAVDRVSERKNEMMSRVKRLLPTVYAVLRRLEVNLRLSSSFVVFPRSSLYLPISSSPSFVSSFSDILSSRSHPPPPCLCVSTPALTVTSPGAKETLVEASPEIPVPRLADFVFSGERLPWTLRLEGFAVYSVLSDEASPFSAKTVKNREKKKHRKQKSHDSLRLDYLIHPSTTTGTLAVSASGGRATATGTAASKPPLLSLCVHADLDPQVVAVSRPQLALATATASQLVVLHRRLADVASALLFSEEATDELKDKDDNGAAAAAAADETLEGAPPPLGPTSNSRRAPSTMASSSREDDTRRKGAREAAPEVAHARNQEATADDGVVERVSATEPHLSLWIQWTLPKATFKMFGFQSGPRGAQLLVVADSEDATASVDVQEIYSKVKLKIGAFQVNHFVRSKAEEEWRPGPYLGVVLTSSPDRLTSHLQIVHDRVAYSSISPASDFFAPLPRPLDKSRAFLALTLTSALCRNVRARIERRRDEGETADGARGRGSGRGRLPYLHEICLKMQPCDVILQSSLVVAAAAVAEPLISLLSSSMSSSSSTSSSSSSSSSTMLNFFTSQLPLVYLTTSSMRIFMPIDDDDDEDEDERDVKDHQASSSWPFLPPPVRHDLLLFQVGEAVIVPQADNPLPRMVLDQDAFDRAVRRGKLNVPGSEVEDRQYQIDLNGINLSTGCWKDVQSLSGAAFPGADDAALTSGYQHQNPAVEWNKLDAADADNLGEGLNFNDSNLVDSVVKVVPIATTFDLRIVAAPAVARKVFETESARFADRWVCGHSMEINATTDVDLFLGQHQLDLGLDLLGQTIRAFGALADVMNAPFSSSSSSSSSKTNSLTSVVADSGIDSDALSQRRRSGSKNDEKRGISLFNENEETNKSGKITTTTTTKTPKDALDFVPFDVLLTANKISFFAYEYCPREPKAEKPAQAHTSSELEDPYDGDESSSSSSSPSSSYSFVVAPLLSVGFAQPHTLVSCSHQRQRLELSCFDASLRGAAAGRRVDSDEQLLPFANDFEMPWIETKQGEPNPKTGILPSLYTIKVEDFLSRPTKMSLIMDRPICATLSVAKFDLFSNGLNSLTSRLLSHPTVDFLRTRLRRTSSSSSASSSYSQPPNRDPSRLLFGGAIGHASLSTNQLVLRFEASEEDVIAVTDAPRKSSSKASTASTLTPRGFDSEPNHSSVTRLTLSCSEFSANVGTSSSSSSSSSPPLSHLEALFSFYDANASVESHSRRHQLVGPFHFQAGATVSKMEAPAPAAFWGQNLSFPFRFTGHVTAGIVRVNLGQDQFLALRRLAEEADELRRRIVSIPCSSSSISSPLPSVDDEADFPPRNEDDDVERLRHPTSSIDDLRSGAFVYVKDPAASEILPRPWEIAFRTSTTPAEEASMTWRYPEPRAVTAFQVSPVPFAVDAGVGTGRGAPSAVPCLLQYFDDLKREFVTYKTFCISESQSAILDLHGVDPSDLQGVGISDAWRVVIKERTGESSLSSPPSPTLSNWAKSALVPPSALAAAARVDSCYSPAFRPRIQFAVRIASLHLVLANHPVAVEGKTPAWLAPFSLASPRLPREELGIVVLDRLAITLALGHGGGDQWSIEAKASPEANLVEMLCLTSQPFVEPFDVCLKINSRGGGIIPIGRFKNSSTPKVNRRLPRPLPTDLTVSLETGPIFARLSQGAVHTISLVAEAWSNCLSKTPTSAAKDAVVSAYHVICNDSRQTIRFGQVNTDEELQVDARGAVAYSWRSQRTPLRMRFGLASGGSCGAAGSWTEAVDIDVVGNFVRSVETASGVFHLVISISRPTSVRKKILVSGQFLVASRLNQHLQVRLVPKEKTDPVNSAELTSVLGAKSTSPSFFVDPADVDSLKFRIMGPSKAPWSDPVSLSALRSAESPLFLGVQFQGSRDVVEFSLKSIRRQIEGRTQEVILVLPLLCVRTHLPSSLLMEMAPLNEQPSNPLSHQVSGRGAVSQIHRITASPFSASSSSSVELSFRLSSSHQKSDPTVKLTRETLSGDDADDDNAELGFESVFDFDDRSLCDSWPYSTPAPTRVGSDNPSIAETDLDAAADAGGDAETKIVPSVSLTVGITRCWPGLSTLLVDVAPWGLLTNQTTMPLAILDCWGNLWPIPAGATIAPPKLEDVNFQIGMQLNSRNHYSGYINLSKDDNPIWSEEDPEWNSLLLNDSVFFGIRVPAESTKDDHRECLLSLTSRVRHGVRLLVIKPQILARNRTWTSLRLRLHSVPFAASKVVLDPQRMPDVDLPRHNSSPEGVALTMWHQPANLCVASKAKSKNALYVNFALQEDGDEERNEERPLVWSLPIRIRYGGSKTHRISFSIPSSSSSSPHLLTIVELKGVVHLIVDDDPHPILLLRNLSRRPLHFGQALDDAGDDAVWEALELVADLPTLSSGGAAFYTPPSLDAAYPAPDTATLPRPRLRFAAPRIEKGEDGNVEKEERGEEGADFPLVSESGPVSWSASVDPWSLEDTFVRVPGCGEFRVKRDRRGNLTRLSLTGIERAEFSAKDVRSRIKGGKDEVPLVRGSSFNLVSSSPSPRSSTPSFFPRSISSADSFDEGTSFIDFGDDDDDGKSLVSQDSRERNYSSRSRDDDWLDDEDNDAEWSLHFDRVRLSLVSSHFCLIVLDDLRRQGSSVEAVRLTFDDIFLCASRSSRSVDPTRNGASVSGARFRRATGGSGSSASTSSARLLFAVADFQMDNQLAVVDGGFDFPVVFMAQHSPESETRRKAKRRLSSHHSSISEKSFSDFLLDKKLTSIFCFDAELAPRRRAPAGGGGGFSVDITDLQVYSQPVVLFLEDVFLRDVFRVVESFLPQPPTPPSSSAAATVGALPSPPPTIRLGRLKLHPVHLLLSVHASLKLYIAADHSPLSFGVFERTEVRCDAPTLLRALALHYVTGTLFRAGWVIGSLELLGSPTGLVRSLGQGIADLVQMPYQGLNNGPRQFFKGVSAGGSSLVKHVSGGMLTSMTNFASSVSRNMDRLSLDDEYRNRQELFRRQVPVGVTSGLYQGLTGFGLSILGAVAGVADQPLQGIFAAANSDPDHATWSKATTGVVKGVGKGLAGVVTKPIGGAAELVAQTGAGLLQGAGLSVQPQPRYVPICGEAALGSSSLLKFQTKLFNPRFKSSSSSTSSVVFALEAIKSNSGGLSIPCQLVLTSTALYIVSNSEDIQQQAFAISDIRCFSLDDDDSLIFVEPERREGEGEANKDRLAEYIQDVALSSRPSATSSLRFDESSFNVSTLESSSIRLDASQSSDEMARTAFRWTSRRLARVRLPSTETSSSSSFTEKKETHEFVIEPSLHDLFLSVFYRTKNNGNSGRTFLV